MTPNKYKIMEAYVENPEYVVAENKGSGFVEDPCIETHRKEFKTLPEALTYLDDFRKDKGKSWANFETPYTYIIYKKTVRYEKVNNKQ